MKKLICYLLLCLMAWNCSHNSEEKVEIKKYSDDTDRAFRQIEFGETAPMRSYTPSSSSTTKPSYVPSPPVDRPIVIEDLPKEKIITTISPPPSPKKEPVNERLVELEQNLNFYCMKHRKDPAFSGDEKKCTDFTTASLEQCQKDTKSHAKLLSCVQNRLKNRR